MSAFFPVIYIFSRWNISPYVCRLKRLRACRETFVLCLSLGLFIKVCKCVHAWKKITAEKNVPSLISAAWGLKKKKKKPNSAGVKSLICHLADVTFLPQGLQKRTEGFWDTHTHSHTHTTYNTIPHHPSSFTHYANVSRPGCRFSISGATVTRKAGWWFDGWEWPWATSARSESDTLHKDILDFFP